MSLQSLQSLLGVLDQNNDRWHKQQSFRQLTTCWFEMVGSTVAAHTRPVGIQRHVLQVATSSSVWAQNLAFERLRLLEKLNAGLSLDLVDIRFSTAHWYRDRPGQSPPDSTAVLWKNHPSRVQSPSLPPTAPVPDMDTPLTAFQRWADQVRARSHPLPSCPQCHCPTPVGELNRWSVCALCVTKQWR